MNQNIDSVSNVIVNNNKPNKSPKQMTFEQFLKTHTLSKDASKDSITHTEFGEFSSRKFHIPETDEIEFENLYYKDIIKANKTHNIIERQFIKDGKTPGPILVDIDLRFSAENTTRQYTFQNHIFPFLEKYLAEIQNLFQMDEDVRFPVFIQEKPAPRVVIKDTGNIVHDGFHMIIGLAVDPIYHKWLREKLLESLPDLWNDLPIINVGSWKDVLDDSISNGTNGWLKYASKKKDDLYHYKVTHAFEYVFNMDNEEWTYENIPLDNEVFFLQKHYRQLSARYRDFSYLFCKESMLSVIQQFESEKKQKQLQSSPKNTVPLPCDSIMEPGYMYTIPIHVLRSITKKEDLEMCLNSFLDNLSPSEYELRETYEYTMILPEIYYGDNSYNKWIRVGFALKNMSNRLLVVFLWFSAQFKNFQYSTQIQDICDRWEKFDMKKNGMGVSHKSIMYWAKNDAIELYNNVRENTIDYFLDQTIESITLEQINNPRKKNAKGCSDYDIATVLFHLCGDEFMSTSIKGNEWYLFKNHRWIKNDSGTTLRNIISTKLRELYRKKAEKLSYKAAQYDPESDDYKIITGRAMKIIEITFTLGSTKDKDNIMKEARELFYNPEFMDKLDQDKYLMCFKNGVVDFRNKLFRKGYPEDYISKCTDIDYIPLCREIHYSIIQEIENYMRQLFPEPELCEYVWNHLASCLIGDTALNQCLHYYTGIGQNGKSMLVKFMQLVLGSYSGELDVGFYTQERSKRGQSTPELFAIIGVRYAITSEPSEGDKMNEGPMKQLTSGTDPMSCRAPYGQLVKFIPQANAIIMANHFLEIRSRDHGTWRRVRVIEFKSLFTDNPVQDDKDKPYQFLKVDNLDIKFDEWKLVFMAMLVEIAFKTSGIVKVCNMVSASSNRYRQNQDFLSEFMAEKIVKNPTGSIAKSELSEEFNSWYKQNYGSRVNKIKELYSCMDRQYGAYKDGWHGVCISYNRNVFSGANRSSALSVNSGTDHEEDEYEVGINDI